MKKILAASIILLLYAPAWAQTDDSVFISRIANEILTNGKAYEDLRVLTKQIGGRLSGSPQMVKAEQWGLNTIQSAHPDKAWLQQCMVPHWVRGGKDLAIARLAPASASGTTLDVLALGNSKGTG